MIYKKVILLVLLTAFAVFSHQINISGKVTDTSGVTPIAGAVVKLEKHGYTVTTGADGIFTLTGAVGIGQSIHQLDHNALLANMRNGMLTLYVPERGAVSITTYTIQGKAVSKIEKVLDKGTHSIAQPDLGQGVYVYKIQTGSRELVLKSSSLGRTGSAIALSAPTTVTASSASRYVPIDDVIRVVKEGNLNCRIVVNNSDTSGMVIKMISQDAGTVTDIDGNVYKAIRIGNQVWTVENWRSTKYNDGTAIPNVTDDAAWSACSSSHAPAYCYYNNATHPDTIKKWGALYNWYVVSPANLKKVAPTGWHVSTDAEWDTLQNYLIANGYNWDGTTTGDKIVKSMAARTDWANDTVTGTIGCNLSINNASGFSALPGGYRNYFGYFYRQGYFGYWWSSTVIDASYAYYRTLCYDFEYLDRYFTYKSCGFSVRLLRDLEKF